MSDKSLKLIFNDTKVIDNNDGTITISRPIYYLECEGCGEIYSKDKLKLFKINDNYHIVCKNCLNILNEWTK